MFFTYTSSFYTSRAPADLFTDDAVNVVHRQADLFHLRSECFNQKQCPIHSLIMQLTSGKSTSASCKLYPLTWILLMFRRHDQDHNALPQQDSAHTGTSFHNILCSSCSEQASLPKTNLCCQKFDLLLHSRIVKIERPLTLPLIMVTRSA